MFYRNPLESFIMPTGRGSRMKESYRECTASPPGSQPCEGGREAALEAWGRAIRRQGMELRNPPISGADSVRVARRQHEGGRQRGRQRQRMSLLGSRPGWPRHFPRVTLPRIGIDKVEAQDEQPTWRGSAICLPSAARPIFPRFDFRQFQGRR